MKFAQRGKCNRVILAKARIQRADNTTLGGEKKWKVWHRKWKLRLIGETNPEGRDLYDEVVGLDSSLV